MDLALKVGMPSAPAAPGPPDAVASAAPAVAAGLERHLWHSRFGLIVIEVRAGEVFVNGQRVQPWRG